MVLPIPEGEVETVALALMFAIAVLSYAARGNAEIHYDAGDHWMVQHLVEHLRFGRGTLVLDTDYALEVVGRTAGPSSC